jgi:hypothetical protein
MGVGIFWHALAELSWHRSFAGASQSQKAPANINPKYFMIATKSIVQYLPVLCIHTHLLLYPIDITAPVQF